MSFFREAGPSENELQQVDPHDNVFLMRNRQGSNRKWRKSDDIDSALAAGASRAAVPCKD